MRRSYVRGVVAMEDEEVKRQEAEASASETVLDNAESAETEMLEVADAEVEGEEREEQVEEAGEVVEALESIAQVLKVSAANGGLDKHAAAILGIATEHLYTRVGMKATKSAPSLESFGGTSTRIGATQLAMEDIAEKAKKIWASIIAAFEKAIQWAKDFFTRVFQSWEKLEKRANDLSSKSENAKGGHKVENSGIVKSLAVAGAAPVLPAQLGKFEDFTKEVFGGTTGRANEMNSTVTLAEAGPEGIAKSFKLDPATKWFSGLKEASGFPAVKDGLATYVSDEQFGGMALVVVGAKEALTGKAAADAVSGMSFKIGPATAEPKEVTVKELPALDAAGVKSVTTAVIAAAKSGLAYKNNLNVVTEQKKKLIATAKKHANDAEGGADLRAVLMGLSRNIDQPAASASAYSLRTSKALLDYVEESLKTPKAEK